MVNLLSKLHRIFNKRSTGELKAVTGAISDSLDTVSQDISLLDLQYIIQTSTGEWLDEYGSWFGISRSLNESDELFRQRMLAVATKPKNTIPALTSAIDTQMQGTGTTIFQPFTRVARHNVFKYSGVDRYMDGIYYRWNTIDIIMPYNLTEDLRKTVESIKAGGIKVFFTCNSKIELEEGDKFDMIPSSEYTLSLDIPLINARSGMRHSDRTNSSNPMSGNRILWGCYIDQGIELPAVDFLRKIKDSYLTDRNSYIIRKPLPKLEIKKYSVSDGLVSGNPSDRVQIIDTYDPQAVTDVQGSIERRVWSMRPATYSHHNDYSGMYSYCGVPEGGWIDKSYSVQSDAYVESTNTENNSEISIEIQSVVIDLGFASFSGNKIPIMSGNKITWSDSPIIYLENQANMGRQLICSPSCTIADIGNIPIGSIVDTQAPVTVELSNNE